MTQNMLNFIMHKNEWESLLPPKTWDTAMLKMALKQDANNIRQHGSTSPNHVEQRLEGQWLLSVTLSYLQKPCSADTQHDTDTSSR